MNRFLATELDRAIIRLATVAMRAHSAEPIRPIQDWAPWQAELPWKPAAQPAAVHFTSKRQFHFPSSLTTPWPRNNRVSGRLYRSPKATANAPAVVLLHGWNSELGYLFHFPFIAAALVRAGIQVAMFELPYHGARKPREPGAVRNFISGDLSRSLEACAQAVADASALQAWLRAQGAPRVGVWGISLGGWLGGLCAAVDPQTSFAVLMTPMADIWRGIQTLPFCASLRQALPPERPSFLPLTLRDYQPRTPAQNILLVISQYDLFVPPESLEDLHQSWRGTETWRVNHGHISVLLSLPILRRTIAWIRARTKNPQAPIAKRQRSTLS